MPDLVPPPHLPAKRVLVAPLDWGLGHTTRCIPLINELHNNGAEVIMAGNEVQEKILKAAFPNLRFLYLPGYNVRYAKSGKNLPLKMLQQAPRMLQSIRAERRWLNKAIAEYNIHAVISDNRYGMYNKKIPSVFVTHQLLIKNPMGAVFEKWLQQINYAMINRFSECWIPDFEGPVNLAGALSHPAKSPSVTCRYIGPLSRFRPLADVKKEGLLVLLSGPEPQRTLFESLLLAQLPHCQETVTVVRGLPAAHQTVALPGVSLFNHLDQQALNKAMSAARIVISRSGYSTVMDLQATGARAILVPTPGQTEQEYLAKYLEEKRCAISCTQQNFSLEKMLQKAAGFAFEEMPVTTHEMLAKIIKEFVQRLAAPASGG